MMMKKTLWATLLAMSIAGSAPAQVEEPVKWHFRAHKKGDRIYELHFTPEVHRQWHIYSQASASEGPTPTTVTLDRNPLVIADSGIVEHGKVVSKYEELMELTVRYFEGPADFVQTVRLKAKVKTRVTGTVEYMACKDGQCLPPQKVSFSIALE